MRRAPEQFYIIIKSQSNGLVKIRHQNPFVNANALSIKNLIAELCLCVCVI